ncbi:MAG: lipoate--protein ligase family protein [Anaerolineales bacterium]|nr:lipoate--protein ligase family protein [Anaerolineales bacterium]
MTPSKPAIWRLIKSKPGRGPWNMAVDEAILESTIRGHNPPTLRLYAWDPPCLSLGYAQPVSDVNLPALETFGWDLVRRPTGGRAILHTDELTYSVCGPDTDPVLAGDILSSYQRLSSAILAALQQIGLGVQALPKEKETPGRPPEPICFETPSNYEITINSKKLVGSAQSRRKNGVLQHGTLPLTGNLTRITQVLNFPDATSRQAAGERLLERATTIHTSLGTEITWEQAAAAIINAFETVLNLDLIPGELTSTEVARAEVLLTEKFSNPEWNLRA